MTTKTQNIEFRNLVIDDDVQPRAALNNTFIVSYAEDMANCDKFPPGVAFFDGKKYWLADGFHRAAAIRRIRLDSIDCIIHEGGKVEAMIFAAQANVGQGLGRSTADKQRAVDMMLRLRLKHPELQTRFKTERDVARHCHVSHTMVQNRRQKILNETGRKNRPRLATVAKKQRGGTESGAIPTPVVTTTSSENNLADLQKAIEYFVEDVAQLPFNGAGAAEFHGKALGSLGKDFAEWVRDFLGIYDASP